MTLSMFSGTPSEYLYELFKKVALYLRDVSHQRICFKPSTFMILIHEDYAKAFFTTTTYYVPDNPTLTEKLKININTSKLIESDDTAYANNLCKRKSITNLVFTFIGGAIIHKPKTQLITTGSSTKAEFIAAHTVDKLA